MAAVERIPFRKLPNQSRLFLEYVELSAATLQFYGAPPTFASLVELSGRLSHHDFPRAEVATMLRRQNLEFGSDDGSLANIDLLLDPGTVAIVTGQQVGLFTGPLYTVYKALSTIRIAARLRDHGIRAVPVFWMDTDDHDLAEITHATLAGPDSQLRTADFLPVLHGPVPAPARSTGSLPLPVSIETVVGEYVASIPGGPHRDQVASDIRASYQPGVGYATAFARLMARLFRGRGLILFDPHDPRAKQLLSPLFREAVVRNINIRQLVLERNHRLAQLGLHAQVAVLENSTLLFLEHEGERRALAAQDGHFQLKGADAAFSPEELVELAEKDPQRFSPNVLLRPVAQDVLFPTAAYVAGPAETAYFAQAQVLYPLFGRPMPVIWPRDSFTLLEPEVSAVMESYQLGLEDCLAGKHHLTERMIQAGGQASGLSRVKDLQKKLEQQIGEMRPAVATADASLGPALDTARRKVRHQLEALEAKFVHFESRRDSHFTEMADFLVARCFPNRSLQERQLGIHPFAARFGPALLDVLYSLCAGDTFAHQVVSLPEVE